MTKELSASEKAFNQARKQFVNLSQRTTRALTRERNLLARQLKKANARSKKIRAQIDTKRERLTKTAGDKAAATTKAQIKKLRQVLAEARDDTRGIRSELAAVRADLASAADHLLRALHVDKAMVALEKQWARAARGKGKKKPAARKKAVAKKKPTAKKKSAVKA
jgi:colicin import membrane protein